MSQLKQAMSAAQEHLTAETDNTKRVREIAEHNRLLPSIRREALQRNFHKEAEALRLEMIQREAVAQQAIERLEETADAQKELLLVARGETSAGMAAAVLRFENQIDAIDTDLRAIKEAAAIKRGQIIRSSQQEIAEANAMLDMLTRALEGQAE